MSPFLICGQKITDTRSLKRVHYKVQNDVSGNQSKEIEVMSWRLHNTGFIPGYTEFELGQFRDKNTKVTKNSSRIEMEKCLIGHGIHFSNLATQIRTGFMLGYIYIF